MSELKLISINDCCDILDNQRIPLNEEQRAGIKGNIPYYGANGVQGYIDKYIFDEPLILLAEDGGNFDDFLNKPIAYRITGKSWVNNHAHVLRVKDEYDYAYVFYSLQHKNITSFIKGGTRAKLNQSELKQITIWDAPYTVQKKIGVLLQALDKEIDAGRELINKYKLIKLGMMSDLFSRGIDPASGKLRPSVQDAPELYIDSILGPIPCGWNINRFDLIAEVIDPNPSHRYPDSIKFGGVPIASTENFDGDDEFELSKCKHISEAEFNKQLERCNYQCDDVIFARKGRIGFARKYGMVQKAFSHTLVVMKAKAGIKPSYLLWLVRSEQFLSAIDFEMNSNSGVPTLGIDVIKRIPSLMPSEAEQGLIARVLDQLNELLSKEKKTLRQLHLKKAGLMRDLLTGKVPVSV
ncbi:restriction endonuclease subunit S [Aeromonas hydrophila]